MLQLKVNLEAMEAMMYFWEATKGREKVNERFINELAGFKPMLLTYDEEFTRESVRKVLSTITNREPFAPSNRKEGRFFNNNLWMLEDLSLASEMMASIKTLNLAALADDPDNLLDGEGDITVFFAPLHVEPCYKLDRMLVLNFFFIQPDFADSAMFDRQPLKKFIGSQLKSI